MSPIHIISVTAERLETPLYNPFITSQGTATRALAVAVKMQLSDGRVAEGESVPVTYVTGETIETVLETAQKAGTSLIGLEAGRYRPAFERIAELAPDQPSARCGLEMAVLDAWSQVSACSLDRLWGGTKDQMETDVTIPIVPNAEELTRLAWELGIRVFKIKVGDSDIEADRERVRAVLRAAPGSALRIDANQAFTPENALRFVEWTLEQGAHLQLLEQPVKKEDFSGMNWIAERSPVPVFADESCRTPQLALRLLNETAVQGFNLKINKCGIGGVLDILPIARAAGRRLMLGCMLETRRSIAVSLALACGTGAFEFLDLDSHLLLNEPGENRFFHQEGGKMTLNTP